MLLSQIRFDDAPLSHAVGSRQKGKHFWQKGKHLCCALCVRTNGSSPMSPSPLAVLLSLRPSLPSHVEAPHVCCACSEHRVAGLCRSAVADPVRLSHFTDPTIFKIFLFFLSLFLCYVCTPCDAPVSSLPCIVLSVDLHARVTPSHSTFIACR